MTSLVYLARLGARLPPWATYTPCSGHRIFLASVMVAAKVLNDMRPKNKQWTRYAVVKGYPWFEFTLRDVNLMERQFLSLLDWDIQVIEDDLFEHFEPLLAPIRWRKQPRQPTCDLFLHVRDHDHDGEQNQDLADND